MSSRKCKLGVVLAAALLEALDICNSCRPPTVVAAVT